MAKAKKKPAAGAADEKPQPYICQFQVKHKGDTYEKDEPIELTESEAAQLGSAVVASK